MSTFRKRPSEIRPFLAHFTIDAMVMILRMSATKINNSCRWPQCDRCCRLFLELDLFLTQPLRTAVKVGGKLHSSLFIFTVIETLAKCFNPCQTLFWSKEYYFICLSNNFTHFLNFSFMDKKNANIIVCINYETP